MSLTLPKTCAMGSSKTGLVGTIGITLLNPDGSVHTPRTTDGIYEIGGGCYGKDITFPDNWKGIILWDTGGIDPAYAVEDFNLEWMIDKLSSAEEIADAVLDEPLSEHTSSDSLGEKISSIRTRVPRSPWTKEDLDKLFSILDEILKLFDSLPTVQKFQSFFDSIQSSCNQLQADSAALQSILDRHSKLDKKLSQSCTTSEAVHSTLQQLSRDVSSLMHQFASFSSSLHSTWEQFTQSTDFIRSSLPKSLAHAQKEHTQLLDKLHSNLNQLSQNFPAIIHQLKQLQNNIDSVIKNESATSEAVHSTLQQLSAISTQVDRSMEEFRPLFQAVLISNLSTDTIIQLLVDGLHSQDDVSEFMNLIDNLDDQFQETKLYPNKAKSNNDESKEV